MTERSQISIRNTLICLVLVVLIVCFSYLIIFDLRIPHHGRRLQRKQAAAWAGLDGKNQAKGGKSNDPKSQILASTPVSNASPGKRDQSQDKGSANTGTGTTPNKGERRGRHGGGNRSGHKRNPKNTVISTRTGGETSTEEEKANTIEITQEYEDTMEIPPPWSDIPMPKKSYYAGFSPPNDPIRWKLAQVQASRGEQVLLSKVLEKIKSPFDYIKGSVTFKWVHHLADYHKARVDGYLKDLSHLKKSQRAPITMLGYRKFDRPSFEGHMTGFDSMNPDEIIGNPKFNIPHKIVGLGSMDENWGWLSTYFLNRTVPWALSLSKHPDPWSKDFAYCNDYIAPLLNDSNLVALFVNQHHNCSHPKILAFPLGINDPKEIWSTVHKAVRSSLKKDQLIFTAGSNYAFRPKIRNCIANNMGSDMVINGRISSEAFRLKIVSSMAVLCMPGLGYDTYRLWETLGSGSLPVLERGFGMDRTFYKLPVLLLDDFADLTGPLLRQAYLEALYHADDWEYERMTTQYWQQLIFEVSETGSLEPLLSRHPMSGEDVNFTRPLVPYDCDAMGGCGPGTKRTPKKYCAVDPSVMHPGYNWVWNHGIND